MEDRRSDDELVATAARLIAGRLGIAGVRRVTRAQLEQAGVMAPASIAVLIGRDLREPLGAG